MMRTSLKHRRILFEETSLPIDLQDYFMLEEKSISCEVIEALGISKEELFIIKQRMNRA